MPLTLIAHGAAPLNALTPSGHLRGLAGRLGHAHCDNFAVTTPAIEKLTPGRVTSAGTWTSTPVQVALAKALGPTLTDALRPTFEWYLARGAFFHNDAHYEDVLFGVWCVAGPRAELVSPRAGRQLDASPGAVAVFDPFEVHGVLAPGRGTYAPQDYAVAEPSVFIGFELELTTPVAECFGVLPASKVPALSSRTRIDSATGAFV